jgi:hypothetical protein
MPLTQARWLLRRATGVHGTLTSSIITCNTETHRYVNWHNVIATVGNEDYNLAGCFMLVWNLLFNIKQNAGWGIQQSGPYTDKLMWDLTKLQEKLHELNDHIRQEEVVKACGMYKEDQQCTQGFGEETWTDDITLKT